MPQTAVKKKVSMIPAKPQYDRSIKLSDIQGVDTLFLKNHRHILFFQFSDGQQGVYRVSCESAHRLCQYHAD